MERSRQEDPDAKRDQGKTDEAEGGDEENFPHVLAHRRPALRKVVGDRGRLVSVLRRGAETVDGGHGLRRHLLCTPSRVRPREGHCLV